MADPTVHWVRWYKSYAVCGLYLINKPVYASVREADVTCSKCLAATHRQAAESEENES